MSKAGLAQGPLAESSNGLGFAKRVGKLSMTKKQEECCGRGKNNRRDREPGAGQSGPTGKPGEPWTPA